MKKAIIISILALALMEGISWRVYTKDTDESVKLSEPIQSVVPNSNIVSKEEKVVPIAPPVSKAITVESGSFPPPSTEVVNGVTERTIHIGVRKWAWDPKVIRVKEGELVRLVVHNADVRHGLAIPELGVNEDIPPDGAVVAFKATKKGTFDFFCSVYCGVGHAEMQGRIIVE